MSEVRLDRAVATTNWCELFPNATERWAREEESEHVVADVWIDDRGESTCQLVMEKIKATRVSLLQWSRQKFDGNRRRVRELRAEIAGLHDHIQNTHTVHMRRLACTELDRLLEQEEVFWKQRSRVLWLEDGDRNTAYFHRRASQIRKANQLKGLRDEGGVLRQE
ncbi:hypothetical protein Tsubulata_034299 [Turnera subulata]|uniref:Uncharacterized protein n=1 Tax=Turnera subulata TaxID=218843 RepID=A0A9Q0F352_9ROSI|nr:hypothetical protein Tsubulata_034299 [Turnera subulata]